MPASASDSPSSTPPPGRHQTSKSSRFVNRILLLSITATMTAKPGMNYFLPSLKIDREFQHDMLTGILAFALPTFDQKILHYFFFRVRNVHEREHCREFTPMVRVVIGRLHRHLP